MDLVGSARTLVKHQAAHARRPEQAQNSDAAPSEALINHTASDATEATIDNCSIVPHTDHTVWEAALRGSSG